MELLLGEFGPFAWPISTSEMRSYTACVYIPFEDHPRLECCSFEANDKIPPCLSYIHDNFSMGSWATDRSAAYRGETCWWTIYFTTYENALLFYMRWAG